MYPNDGRVVSNFIMQALKDEEITVFGDGKQTRSFCYVDDMVDGLVKLMNSPDDFTGPVNLGNPVEFSILELAEMVIKLVNSSPLSQNSESSIQHPASSIVFRSLPSDDPQQRQPDITLAEKELDWKPTVKLEEGLKKTIEYFRNLI
jgi:UDP-glucuronate decarboxylase